MAYLSVPAARQPVAVPAPSPAPVAASVSWADRLAYAFFVALTADFFIRPADLFKLDFSFYQYLIGVVILFKFFDLLSWASLRRLSDDRIGLCIVGMLFGVFLSHFTSLEFGLAFEGVTRFVKIAVFVFLMVTVLNRSSRLKNYVAWLTLFITLTTTLALLQYKEYIHIESLEQLEQKTIDPVTGKKVSVIRRMRSVGVFNDPNDLCLILILGAALSLYLRQLSKKKSFRFLMLANVGLMTYALVLTRSRGGFLALVAAFLYYIVDVYGRKRAVLIVAALLPVLMIWGGRQTDLGLDDATDTSHARIRLWAVGMAEFQRHPIFGMGFNQYSEVEGYEVHNSFITAFAELGVFGGTFFLGIFFFTMQAVRRLKPKLPYISDPTLRLFRGYFQFAAVGSIVGLLSLTRNSAMNIYLVPGLAMAYFNLLGMHAYCKAERFDGKALRTLMGVSFATLLFFKLFVMNFARWGV